jgi:hypothetical protein
VSPIGPVLPSPRHILGRWARGERDSFESNAWNGCMRYALVGGLGGTAAIQVSVPFLVRHFFQA